MPDRSAVQADLPALVALERLCFGEEAYTSLQLRQWLDLGGPLVRVADGSGGLDGYAIGALAHDGSGWLLALGVRPEARGRGLGRALTSAVLDALHARGVHEVQLTVTPGNTAARALYAALGFVGDEVHRDYYGPGQHRLVMRHKA